MIEQFDWALMLPSVLFAIRTSKHSSTGYSSYHMLYNKDPIMPFQHADWLKHAVISDDELSDEYDSDATEVYEAEASTKILNSTDPLLSTIQNLENQCKQILDKTHKSIKKVQIHQAKGYNNRQAKGVLRLVHMYSRRILHGWGARGSSYTDLSMACTLWWEEALLVIFWKIDLAIGSGAMSKVLI